MDDPKFPVDIVPEPIEINKPISEEYIRIDDIKLLSILDKEFFGSPLPEKKNDKDVKEKVKQKLNHVIKSIDNHNKNKKNSVELYEKRVKKKKPHKKASKDHLRQSKSSQPRSSNNEFRKSTQEFLKNIPKSRSERDTNKFKTKKDSSKKTKNSIKKTGCSNTNSRITINSFKGSKNSIPKPKPQFETKFLAQVFATSSDSEPSQQPSSVDPKILDKYRTVPKTPKLERVRKKRSVDLIDRELALLFEKNKKKNTKSWKVDEQPPLFEKVSGDKRDLPEIYFRFLRRSRLTHSNVKLRNKNVDENLDSKVEDFILGQILKDQEINYPVLDMINKTPFKYENLFENVKDITETEVQTTSKQIIKNNITTPTKKKIVKSVVKKKSSCKSRGSETSQESLKSIKSTKAKSPVKHLKPTEKQVVVKKAKVEIKKEAPIQNSKKNSIIILKNDPIHENMNLSPSTAVTMMVLSAERNLSENPTYFRKFDHLQRLNTIKTSSSFVPSN